MHLRGFQRAFHNHQKLRFPSQKSVLMSAKKRSSSCVLKSGTHKNGLHLKSIHFGRRKSMTHRENAGHMNSHGSSAFVKIFSTEIVATLTITFWNCHVPFSVWFALVTVILAREYWISDQDPFWGRTGESATRHIFEPVGAFKFCSFESSA